MSLKKILFFTLFLTTLLSTSMSGNAAVITFDEMAGRGEQVGPDYQGYKFAGFGVLNNTFGYGTHATSGNVYAYAYCCGTVDTISSMTGVFNFVGADLSSMGNTTESYTIKGYLGATELFSKLVTVTGQVAAFSFNFTGIDKISFSSGNGNLTLDNIKLTTTAAVPEPASLMLLALGFLGLVASRSKGKRA